MPVYNGEKYLPRSINAILTQTYSDIELILINDGSTDSSKLICERFADSDPRIRYFEQENHGQGYTRAKGINLAKGEYVAFVDQDDWMHPEMYGTMLETILRDHTDVCACQWNYELPDGTHSINNKIYDETFYGVKTSVEFARYLYKYNKLERNYGYANGLVVSPWNKLYRKDLLTGFISTGYLGEDEDMNDFVFSQKNITVSIIKNEFYYWYQNIESMSNRPFSTKKWEYFDAYKKRLNRYQDSYIIISTYRLIFNYYIENYYKAKEANILPPTWVKKLFYSSCKGLMKTGNLDIKSAIRMSLFCISPSLYKRLLF